MKNIQNYHASKYDNGKYILVEEGIYQLQGNDVLRPAGGRSSGTDLFRIQFIGNLLSELAVSDGLLLCPGEPFSRRLLCQRSGDGIHIPGFSQFSQTGFRCPLDF